MNQINKLYFVIKWNGKKEVGINADGSTEDAIEKTDLLPEHKAKYLALIVDGTAVAEDRLFPSEWD